MFCRIFNKLNAYYQSIFWVSSFLLAGVILLIVLSSGKTYNPGPLQDKSNIYNYKQIRFDCDSMVIPLKRAGNLYLIEVVVDGVVGNLVFDSGASHFVLNKVYFRNYLTRKTAESMGITGNAGAGELIHIDNIEFADITFSDLYADVCDLGHLENAKGIKILGLVGLELIKDFEIVFDARNNELTLHKTDKKGNRKNCGTAIEPESVQKILTVNNIIFLQGKIRDKKLKMCFDSGAESNVINKRVHKSVLETISLTGRANLKGAGASHSETLYGKMNEFYFENKFIAGMEVVITNLDDLCEVYGTQMDGVLGYDFFSKGIVIINLKKKTFALCYN